MASRTLRHFARETRFGGCALIYCGLDVSLVPAGGEGRKRLRKKSRTKDGEEETREPQVAARLNFNTRYKAIRGFIVAPQPCKSNRERSLGFPRVTSSPPCADVSLVDHVFPDVSKVPLLLLRVLCFSPLFFLHLLVRSVSLSFSRAVIAPVRPLR